MNPTRILACLLLIVAACGDTTIDASGDIRSESREVDAFDRIDAGQGVTVRLVVDPSAEPAITVNYDENVIDEIFTRVEGDTLRVRLDASVSFSGGGERYVEVITDGLTKLDVTNGANLSASGTASLAALALEASGGANVDLAALTVDSVDVDLSGGTNVTIRVGGSIEGSASGGANLTILGDPPQVDVETSGGASITRR